MQVVFMGVTPSLAGQFEHPNNEGSMGQRSPGVNAGIAPE